MQFIYMSQLSVFLQRTITVLLWLAGAVVFFRWLLAPLLPFLLALALSAMVEPLVQRLRRLLRVRRTFAAAVITTALLLALGGSLTALLLRLLLELQEWSRRLPEVIDGFPALWNGLLDRIGGWYASCPAVIRSALDALAQGIQQNPAWSSLSAVQNGRYVILPEDLFHYKPNKRWGESYGYLANILYPEISLD